MNGSDITNGTTAVSLFVISKKVKLNFVTIKHAAHILSVADEFQQDKDQPLRISIVQVVGCCTVINKRKGLSRARLWHRHCRQTPRAYNVEGAYERGLQNILNIH